MSPLSPYVAGQLSRGIGAGWLSAALQGRLGGAQERKAVNAVNAPGSMTGTAGVPNYLDTYLRMALGGGGGLPAAYYSDAYRQGMAALNAQAEQRSSQLASSLASRGLLTSGMAGQGAATIEAGRLAGAGSLQGTLMQQRGRDVLASQQMAARLYAAAQEAAKDRALQLQLARMQINANDPSTMSLLGGALGSYLQWDALRRLGGTSGGLLSDAYLAPGQTMYG